MVLDGEQAHEMGMALVGVFQRSLELRKSQAKALTDQVAEMGHENESLETKVGELEEEISTLKLQEAASKRTIVALQKKLAVAEATIVRKETALRAKTETIGQFDAALVLLAEAADSMGTASKAKCLEAIGNFPKPADADD
jgi:septal ring factor EnvC (AmiA/AmiB activator)